MDFKKFINENNLLDYPIGLTGCRTQKISFDSCDYDLTVFDNSKQNDEVIDFDNDCVFLHHGNIGEKKSDILIHYDTMDIIQDESWELRILLTKIKERKEKIYKDYAKNCLINAIFCCQKTNDCISNLDEFAPCWQKCASYLLADAIAGLNFICPSSHMLFSLRNLEKNTINENISEINDTLGIERATSSLLQRMLKSTIGFSDIVENNNYSKIIQKKYDYFIENSMLSDCYFYLVQINKNNFLKIKNKIHRNHDYIHILKVAFDIEHDNTLLEQQSSKIQKTSNNIFSILSR